MENEYANFGLPSDPANQPIQPHQTATVQRGWFSRNLWWMLPAALMVVVLPCGCCGGIFVWLIGSLKSSEPYQMALERVRTNPQVIEQLGKAWVARRRRGAGSRNGRIAFSDPSFQHGL